MSDQNKQQEAAIREPETSGEANGSPNDTQDDDGLTTGDMARLCKTTLRTVRFYEQEGLICSQARGDGCHRKFPRTELRKLQMISDLRDAGMSLHDIKTLMDMKQSSESPKTAAGQMSAVLGQCISELQERIDTLARLRTELTSTVTTIRHCQDCPEPAKFPAGCGECDVTKPDSSRTTELLWKS